MYSDYHIHTGHSGDTMYADRVQIAAAIARGLQEICLTEHYDIDYIVAPHYNFVTDLDDYTNTFAILRQEFSDRIRLKMGLEVGLQAHLADRQRQVLLGYDFDFILGSRHVFDQPEKTQVPNYETMTTQYIMQQHMRQTIESINAFDGFNCLAHLTFLSRYKPGEKEEMIYDYAPQEVDELFRLLVQKGIGLEINTNSYSKLGFFVPGYSLVKRFRELGGEILTIGSDAHMPQHVGLHFREAALMAREAGFRHICTFENMQPVFNDIELYL